MTHPMFEGLPEGGEEYELTELQYAIPVKGEGFKLYIFNYEGGSKHGGAQWFTSGKIRYPEEQIPAETARGLADYHIKLGHEVRITNGGDMLVAHWVEGKRLYPDIEVDFWGSV